MDLPTQSSQEPAGVAGGRPIANLLCATAMILSCLVIPDNLRAGAKETTHHPVAGILTYSMRTGKRASYLDAMRTTGLSQLQRWKRERILRSYQVLVASASAAGTPDLFLILRFDDRAGLERWRKIEQAGHGGLPAEAQARLSVVDVIAEQSVAPETPESQYLALEYDIFADEGKYRSYINGYVVPQFAGWEKAGVLADYTVFVKRDPATAPGASLILLRYRDLAALSQRDRIKDEVRAHLAATNPAWERWSEDKTAIRREKTPIPLRALQP